MYYLQDPDSTKNMVNLLLCLGIPPALTLLTSLVKVLFGSVKALEKRYLVMVGKMYYMVANTICCFTPLFYMCVCVNERHREREREREREMNLSCLVIYIPRPGGSLTSVSDS